MLPTIIAIAVVAVIAIAFIVLYNGLVSLRNQADEGWAQIDVQLQRRADLIPNLVNTVKGYAAHEVAVLTEVTNARSALQNASGPKEAAEADASLLGAVGRLLAVSENYPDLKASANFLKLQEELASTENKVSFARAYYNNTVRSLNTKIETFPANLVAGFAKATKREYFEVTEQNARVAPTVSF